MLSYILDGNPLSFACPPDINFLRGSDDVLSLAASDPLLDTGFFETGYSIFSSKGIFSFKNLIDLVTASTLACLEGLFPDRDLTGFRLEDYHHFISEQEHALIADPVLKRLNISQMPELSASIASFASDLCGESMSFDRGSEFGNHWVILRINPPSSSAFNPPHKDVYEDFDNRNILPRMVNFWIPICGVSSRSGLGFAPSSHLFPESQILRTTAGSSFNKKQFSVTTVKSWQDSTSLKTIYLPHGDILCFSSYIIHGLGVNFQSDTTRVALEFRLHAS